MLFNCLQIKCQISHLKFPISRIIDFCFLDNNIKFCKKCLKKKVRNGRKDANWKTERFASEKGVLIVTGTKWTTRLVQLSWHTGAAALFVRSRAGSESSASERALRCVTTQAGLQPEFRLAARPECARERRATHRQLGARASVMNLLLFLLLLLSMSLSLLRRRHAVQCRSRALFGWTTASTECSTCRAYLFNKRHTQFCCQVPIVSPSFFSLSLATVLCFCDKVSYSSFFEVKWLWMWKVMVEPHNGVVLIKCKWDCVSRWSTFQTDNCFLFHAQRKLEFRRTRCCKQTVLFAFW